MAFLAPLFFAALLTLAVPVIIHLTQREKKQVVEFPSLMFLAAHPVSVRAAAPHPRLAAAGHAAGGHPADRARVREAVLRSAAVALVERDGSARSGDAARPFVQHGLRRPLGSRAQAAARQAVQGLRAARSRVIDFVRHRRRAPGARHRGSGACVWPRSTRLNSAPKRRATRPALKLAQRVARRIAPAEPRSRDDQRLPAQRLGARRLAAAARGHHLHAGRHHRPAAGEPRRVVGPAAALDLFRTGADHRGGGHREPGARRRSATSK